MNFIIIRRLEILSNSEIFDFKFNSYQNIILNAIKQSLISFKALQKFLTKREMFPKISFLKLFVDFKLISVLVLVMISTSVDCLSNDSICDFIVRVRDLGIYRFVWNERFSYRLFSREIEGEFTTNQKLFSRIAVEHELEIENWNVSAQPSPINEYYGLLKFYCGFGTAPLSVYSFRHNCRYIYTEVKICLL